MDTPSLVALIVTVVSLLFTAAVTLVVTVISVALPLGILWFVFKQVKDGKRTVFVSGPLVDAVVRQQSRSPAPAGPQLVKQTRCTSCGAPKVQRSLHAYVYCDFCGLLVDWDFQAALADTRSRLPGPTYEALIRSLQPKLTAAKAANDRGAYQAAQQTIWEAYATACPAALPPRIGDPAFRKRLVAWQAASQTDLDFDPAVGAARARQDAAVTALAWDRSDPFHPKIQPGSFDSLLDAVVAHQVASTEALEAGGWLEKHPDHPSAELFQHIGLSALVQGWLPYFKAGEPDRVLTKTGLKGSYHEVTTHPVKSGPCPSCGARIEAVEGAKRVLCESCGHLAGVGTGTIPCHGCATPITLPEVGNLFACPSCDAELRMMRVG